MIQANKVTLSNFPRNIDAPERLSVPMQDMKEGQGGGVEAGAVGLQGTGAGGVIRQLLEGVDDLPEGRWGDGIVAAHWFCFGRFQRDARVASLA